MKEYWLESTNGQGYFQEIKEGLRKCAWFDETKFTYEL